MYSEKIEDLVLCYKDDNDAILLIDSAFLNIISEITKLTKIHLTNKSYISGELKSNIDVIDYLYKQNKNIDFFPGDSIDEKTSGAVDMVSELFMNGINRECSINDTGFAGYEYLNSQK